MKSKEALNKAYTTPELAVILGVPTRKVISMLERRYFKPSIQEADGHASRRLYNFFDVARAYIILELLKFGLSVDYARLMGNLLEGEGILEPFLMINQHKDICVTSKDPKEANNQKLDFLNYELDLSNPSLVLYVPLKTMRYALLKRIERLL